MSVCRVLQSRWLLFRTRLRSCELQQFGKNFRIVVFASDDHLDRMWSIAMSARMCELTINSFVTENVAANHRIRRARSNSAAYTTPMDVADIFEMERCYLPVVPLTSHVN
jgi:hypothetical protein